MWYIKSGKHMYFVSYDEKKRLPTFINDKKQAFCSDGYLLMKIMHATLKDLGVDCYLVYQTK